MVEKLDSVWESRDLPVLCAVAKAVDKGDGAHPGSLAADLEMSDEDVQRALAALERRGFIDGRHGDGQILSIRDVSARAYQLTGLHPNPDDRVDKLLDLLDDAIAKSGDEHERTALQAIRDNLGDVGKQTIAGILSALFMTYVGGIGG